MIKTFKFDIYDSFILENNINRHNFLHTYFPILVNKYLPDVTFTMIGDDHIEWPEELDFPSITLITEEVPKIIVIEEDEKGIFEKCFENNILSKITYYINSDLPKINELKNFIPQNFDLKNAFSISEGVSNILYAEDYITVYFVGKYQNRNTSSFGYKISKTTKEILDVKLITTTIPEEFSGYTPENTLKDLFGSFLNNTNFVEIGFSFETEIEFANYLGTNYVAPVEYTNLGKGMIALTIDTNSKEIVRTKRYFFGGL